MRKATKRNAIASFISLANALGKTVYMTDRELASLKKDNPYFNPPAFRTEKYSVEGSWYLDTDGGYRVVEFGNSSGAIRYPISDTLYTASNFYDAVWMVMRVFHIKEKATIA